MNVEFVHIGVTVAGLLVSCLLAYIGLMIKNEMQKTKTDLLAHQIEVRDDLSSRNSDLDKQLAVHVAEDEQRFTGIGRTLERIDTKLDKLTDRMTA